MTNCPTCGKSMDPGCLGAESFIGGAKWYKDKGGARARGEPVAKPGGLGMVYIQGFRCPDCRVLVLRY